MSSVEVRIDTGSFDTQNNVRDEDLRGSHFLDVKAFPTMTYRGLGVILEFGGRWTLEGTLTIRDITPSVSPSWNLPGSNHRSVRQHAGRISGRHLDYLQRLASRRLLE